MFVLQAKVVEAKGLPTFENTNIYTVLCVDENGIQQETEKNPSRNPKWNQEFNFNLINRNSAFLKVKVCNDDGIYPEKVGRVGIPIKSIQKLNKEVDQWYKITNKQGDAKGSIRLILKITPKDIEDSDNDLDSILSQSKKRRKIKVQTTPQSKAEEELDIDPPWAIGGEEPAKKNSFTILSSKKNRDIYMFNINDYKIIKEIKKGGFGVVNLVENKEDETKCAAKTNLIQNTKLSKLYVSREVRILIEVQHPTVIKFRGFSYEDFDGKNNFTIFMDYMINGSLGDLILKEEKGLCPHEYDNTKRQIILIGISRAMMLLHKLHIIHRDIKPDNILLDENFYPHISDFGLSKIFDPNHSMSQSISNAGTIAYMAPEVINGNKFNTKADVYAFGILMYEVLVGKRAYKNLLYGKKSIPIYQFMQKICEGLRPEIKKGMIKKSHQIMIEKCLSKDPKQRPTFSEIYKKLSLSDENFFDFDTNIEQEIINYEEEDENEEEEIGLNTKFCLDSVKYEEILDYVDMIKEDQKSHDNEEVEQMKQKIKELEELTSVQNNQIKELTDKISHLEEKLQPKPK